MKLRNPESIHGALREIFSKLGTEASSKISGKSSSMLAKWSDPDHRSEISVLSALELEAEYVNCGHSSPEMAPIFSVWRGVLEKNGTDIRNTASVLHELLDILPAVGRLSETVSVALTDGVLTPNESIQIKQCIMDIHRELDDLSRSIDIATRGKSS